MLLPEEGGAGPEGSAASRAGRTTPKWQPAPSLPVIYPPSQRKSYTFPCLQWGSHIHQFFSLPQGPTKAPTPAPLFRRVDIALGCSYVGEDARGLLRAFGSSSSEDPATLVLRGVSVRDDGNLDDVTEYKVPQEDPDASSPIVFEASGQWESWGGRAAARVLTTYMHRASTRFFFN